MREADGSFPKACFTVRKVVLPESNKSIVKAKIPNLVFLRDKIFQPFCKRDGIVLGEVILGHQAEFGILRHSVQDGGKRWTTGSGEDVSTNEIGIREIGLVFVHWHGDCLNGRLPVILEQSIDGLEV